MREVANGGERCWQPVAFAVLPESLRDATMHEAVRALRQFRLAHGRA